MTDRPGVTVVTAPREGYALERATVEGLLASDEPIDRIVVVHEARCPRRLERAIRRLADAGRIEHVHIHRRAGANECRAVGLARATTPYVLLLDNDAQLEAGSVHPLVDRAESTGASFVSPVCLNPNGTLHFTGTVVRFTAVDGERRLVETRLHGYGPADDVRPHLEPAPTDAPELHGVLVRRESLERAGGVDVKLQSSMDCLDIGLRLQDVDGGGWLEPAAGVVYRARWPRPWEWSLYFDRWSRATVEHDLERFASQWGLQLGDEVLDDHRCSLQRRRWSAIPKLRGLARRTLGDRAEALVTRAGDALMDRCSSASGPP